MDPGGQTVIDRISTAGPVVLLVERDTELARIEELLNSVQGGAGFAAAVVGPAGIGKTSLLEAAREQASELGLECLSARGGELERDFSFGVVRQLLEPTLRGLSERDRAAVLGGAARAAAPALGFEDEREADGDVSSFAVVHGLYWACVALAERRPLVFFVDDAHWADAASLRFLSYLERRLEEVPVGVLSGARPPAAPSHIELVESVISDAAVLQIAPRPLSVDAMAAIVERSGGEKPDEEFAAAFHRATGGNPFLGVTFADVLAERDVAPIAENVARLGELGRGVTSSVVVRRLGHLAPSAKSLARAIAVLGAEVEPRHARVLAELSEADAAAAADSLAVQGVVRVGRRLEFVHPLVRAAVRDAIPAAERGLQHARAAQMLAADDPARAAVHLLAVPPAGKQWAAEVLRAAARSAIASGDPEAAVAYLARAAEEPPEDSARAETMHELGVAELAAGRAPNAAEHLDRARTLTESARASAVIAQEQAIALAAHGRYPDAARLLEETLDSVADETELRLELGAQLHQAAFMLPASYRRWQAREYVGDRDPIGTTRGERAGLAVLATEGALRTEPADRVRAWASRALDNGLIQDGGSYSSLWINVACPLIFAEGFERTAILVTEAMDDARRRDSPIGYARAHLVGAMLGFRQGAISRALADAEVGTKLGREGGFAFSLLTVGTLVEILIEVGELDRADEELRLSALDEEVPELFITEWALMARGRLRLAQGRTEAAIKDLEELGRRGEDGWWPWNPGMFPYREHLALALFRAGAVDRARSVAEEDLELAHRWGAPGSLGRALRTAGLVRGDEGRIDLLRESVEVLSGSGARLEQARSLVELGAAIRRGGRRADAREPLREGMELAHRCGASVLRERAREELVATGARPRSVVRTGVEALTPSELRVAEMAADGLTNREIAQALFVTLRTVEVHLTHTYQKLDISSRKGLPEALVTAIATTKPLG